MSDFHLVVSTTQLSGQHKEETIVLSEATAITLPLVTGSGSLLGDVLEALERGHIATLASVKALQLIPGDE